MAEMMLVNQSSIVPVNTEVQRRAKSNATRWRQVVRVLVADCNINTKIKNENKFLPLNIL